MIDQPSSEDLLNAMAEALTRDVMPSCDPGPRHIARVVANLCQQLAREQQADIASDTTASDTTASDTTAPDTAALAADLEAALRDGNPTDAEADAALFAQLMASSRRRLAIAKPQYLSAADREPQSSDS